MKKTSVYLTDSEVEVLQRLSEREGKSQAMVLREAIVAYDEAYEAAQDRDFAIFDTFETHGGDGRSIADIPEEELLRGFGENSDPEWELRNPGRTRRLGRRASEWLPKATQQKLHP